jgi:hypothetical protein
MSVEATACSATPPILPNICSIAGISMNFFSAWEVCAIAALLRRVADTIERLGSVEIQDITFGTEITADGPWHHLTVYFHEADWPARYRHAVSDGHRRSPQHDSDVNDVRSLSEMLRD